KTISNFSLTCRELRPRSLCLLVADITLHSRDKLFDFCDFLQTKTHLKPLVHSILVHPKDFAPVPLLYVLRNLPEIRFIESSSFDDYFMPAILNQSTLTSCRLFSTNIQSLSLSNLHFITPIQFLRVLSAFSSIEHLVCLNVFSGKEGELAPLDMAKRRLAPKLHLRTVSHPVCACWDSHI
ncbi:hypothetical protein V8D89_003094, partial [Ganoderma adspersum]